MVDITWTNTQKKARNMGNLAARVETRHTHKWGTEVARAGKESIRQSVVDGGINKTAKGGARIEQGDMFDSADSVTTTMSGVSNVLAGFISGPPAHTIFQERGTRGRRIDSVKPRLNPTKGRGSGIPAMLAIPEAIQAMTVEADNSGYKMLGQIAREWDGTV